MKIDRSKLILVIMLVLAIAFIFYLMLARGTQKLHTAFADDQIGIFYQMKERALSSNPAEAAGYLESIISYYPSGSKQDVGSRLDIIVEEVRQDVIRSIVADLRLKTGDKLGDDPRVWINKYKKD